MDPNRTNISTKEQYQPFDWLSFNQDNILISTIHLQAEY